MTISSRPQPTSRSISLRTIIQVILYLSEIACLLLLLNSLRGVNKASWGAQKVAALRAEATKQANLPTSTPSTTSNTKQATNQTNESQQPTPQAIPSPTQDQGSAEVEMVLKSLFEPLPNLSNTDAPATTQLVDLGRMLYYDPRLSMNGEVSCNSCHRLDNYGVDGLARSVGVGEKQVDRNAPSVYHAALHIAQFWDGRSPTVEDQATKPIMASGEMGMLDEKAVRKSVASIAGYEAFFKKAFPTDPEPISLKNIGIAIGAFERGLLTPSRFDRFLAGDRSQLNEQEQRGLTTFVSLRCPTCHVGVAIGGQVYKRLGEKEAYPTSDLGRYVITHKDEDKYVFKVPSLRNVAKTAPYLHDGSIASLEEMVRLMARYQLGKTATDQQVQEVVAFLNSLTGEISQSYIQSPSLPADSN